MAWPPVCMAVGLTALALAGCADGPSDPSSPVPAEEPVAEQLRSLYVDQPFGGGQEPDAYSFLADGPDHLLFLHWDDADPEKAARLLFVGDAFRAWGCIGTGGVSRDQIDAGYVHFHKEEATSWSQGHHTDSGQADRMGYWFRHIAATDGIDPSGTGAAVEGEAYAFMPSHEDARRCPLIPP